MFELKNIQEYSIKKCKNFGYTFCIVFLLVFLYFFLKDNHNFYYLLLISFSFLVFAIFLPNCLKLFAFYWEKFGILLGRLISPIILILVYLITILPVNLILRIFSIDLLNRRINNKKTSYWIRRTDNKINFRNQF